MLTQEQKLKEIDAIMKGLKTLITRTLTLQNEAVAAPKMPTTPPGLSARALLDDSCRFNREMYWDAYREVRKMLGNDARPRAVVAALANALFGPQTPEKTLTVKASRLTKALMHLHPENAIRNPDRALHNFFQEIGLN